MKNNQIHRMKRIFQIGIENGYLSDVIATWQRSDCKTDIRLRKAKTPGLTVVETEDALFSTEITRICECKVNVKEIR